MKLTKSKFYQAVFVLFGTMVGAGILGIPNVIASAGFLTGILLLLFLGAAVLLVNLMASEVALRTKGRHELSGYAGLYLGPFGKHLMAAALIFGIYGALVAYTIGAGVSLSEIFGGNAMFYGAGFFVVISLIVLFGIRGLGASETLLSFLKIGAFAAIFILLINHVGFNASNLSGFSISKIFVPYGAIFFAYLGMTAIPLMREGLGRRVRLLKDAVVAGTVLASVLYFLFAFSVVGVFGESATEVATTGIGELFGGIGLVLANLFALLAMATPFISLANALKEVYNYDYGLNRAVSWMLVFLVPVLMLLLGARSFIKTIEITGAATGSLIGVLIIASWLKARKKGKRKPEFVLNIPKFVGYLIAVLFVIGAVVTLIDVL